MDTEDKMGLVAAIANGEGLVGACEANGVPVREVVEALVKDVAFAGAVVVAQNERELRHWRSLSLDLHDIWPAVDETASNTSQTCSAVEDLQAICASSATEKP